MRKILVVEDEKKYQSLYKDVFNYIGIDSEVCVFCSSALEAVDWLDSNSESLSAAFLDLKIPHKKGGKFSDEDVAKAMDTKYGYDVFKKLRSKNKDCHVVIVSNYADDNDQISILSGLQRFGFCFDEVLHKQHDLDMERLDGVERFRKYIEPVDDLVQMLQAGGMFMDHPAYERILRKFKLIFDKGFKSWPLPLFLFYGAPGSGKNSWGRVLAMVKAGSVKNYIFEQESLGAFTDPLAGESVGVKLFGARRFNASREGDCAGLFERATRYRRNGSLLARHVLANSTDVPDFEASGVAFLDELDSVPKGVVDVLLNPLSEGVFRCRGLSETSLRLGCVVVFASIVGPGLLEEDERVERGSHALEGFFSRLKLGHRIKIPSLKDLGMGFVREFLSFRAGHQVQLHPLAEELLEEGVVAGEVNIRELSMLPVPGRFRLTYQDVKEVYQPPPPKVRGRSSHDPVSLGKATAWLDAMEEGCKKLLEKGLALNWESLATETLSPVSRRPVSRQRLSQVVNSEDFSPVLRALLRESPGKWPMLRRVLG